MKFRGEPRWLRGAVAAMSLAALALRFLIYRLAVDEKGLLLPTHPTQLALWAVFAAGAAAVLLFAGNTARPGKPLAEALGEMLCAVGIALSVSGSLKLSTGVLDGLHLGFCAVSVAALIYAALRRMSGQQVNVLCYAAACVFFALHAVFRYQGWSSHPQLQDYFFPVLGTLAAMIFSYLRCRDGKIRLRRCLGYIGCIACFAAAGHSQEPSLFLGCGIWLLSGSQASEEAV